jgi:hypothetical protein
MTTATVLPFSQQDDKAAPLGDPLTGEPNRTEEAEPEIGLDDEPSIPLVDEADPATSPPTSRVQAVEAAALVEVLPADFPLSPLMRFVPDSRLKLAVNDATAYALGIQVTGAEGIERADRALTALRGSLKACVDNFAEPADIANRLHKWITGTRAEWTQAGDVAVKTVGQRIFSEQRRLEQLAAEERRRAQELADRQAREAADREVKAAEAAKAPTPVVEELKRQAETATAPPVHVPTSAPAMRGNTTIATWKARIAGTPEDAEPNPKMAELTSAQIAKVFTLIESVLSGDAPITVFELNWSVLNGRAKADKGTLRMAGIEAFEQGSVRAKGRRI